MFYISWYWLCRKISSLPSLTQAFSITNAVFWERHCLKYVSKESFINLIGYINIRSFCLKVIFLPVKKEREIITSSFTQARFVKFRLLKGTRHARWPNTHLVRQVLIHRRTLFCSLGELKIFSATCLPGNGWTLADPLTFLKNWTVTQIETKREHRQRCIFAKCIFVSVFLGHVWGMSETCLGHHPGHVWALSGACLEHDMGYDWGIIWGMSGASSGACLGHVWDNIWGILLTMDNNGQKSAVLHASVMPCFDSPDNHLNISWNHEQRKSTFPLKPRLNRAINWIDVGMGGLVYDIS